MTVKPVSILQAYRGHRFEIPLAAEMSQTSFDNFWFPEELSPWYYLSSYSTLPEDIRKRYNQLYALGTNEVFAIFESEFISHILLKKINSNQKIDPVFKKVIKSFCEEELKHAEMFHKLNKIADPKLYRSSRIALSKQANPLGLLVLYLMKTLPDLFGAWIWLSFFLEERSLVYSKYYLLDRNQHLNSSFRMVHKLHLLEENYHVQLDEIIIDQFYRPLSVWKRKLAAWMLSRFVLSFRQPRRMSESIAQVLKKEFPFDGYRIDACLKELPSIKHNKKFQVVTLGIEATIRFRKMLSRFPEMTSIRKLLAD